MIQERVADKSADSPRKDSSNRKHLPKIVENQMKDLHSSFQKTAKLYNIQPLKLNLIPAEEPAASGRLSSVQKSKTRAPSPNQQDLLEQHSRTKSASKKKREISPRKLAMELVPLDEAWKRANKDISFQLGMSKFSKNVKNYTKFITTLNSSLNEKHIASLVVKSVNSVKDALATNAELGDIHTVLRIVPKRLPGGLEYSRIEAFVANLDDFLEKAKWNIQQLYDPRIPVVIASSSTGLPRTPGSHVHSTGNKLITSFPFDSFEGLPSALWSEPGQFRMLPKS